MDIITSADLPESIAALVAGHAAMPVTIGQSHCSVVRYSSRETGYHLKAAPLGRLRAETDDVESDHPLARECARLRWLRGRVPVPEVAVFTEDAGHAWLLTTTLPGMSIADAAGRMRAEDLVETLAAALRTLHAVDMSQCPFDETLPVRLERARRRMERGLVDETDFDARRLGRTAADLFDELVATIPPDDDRVLTHGDYSLPNIIIAGGVLSGFVDVAACGRSDRWVDIALAMRSIEFNLGAHAVTPFLEAYGIERADRRKADFYQLLDEFA